MLFQVRVNMSSNTELALGKASRILSPGFSFHKEMSSRLPVVILQPNRIPQHFTPMFRAHYHCLSSASIIR